jgi:hypothetical protein
MTEVQNVATMSYSAALEHAAGQVLDVLMRAIDEMHPPEGAGRPYVFAFEQAQADLRGAIVSVTADAVAAVATGRTVTIHS